MSKQKYLYSLSHDFACSYRVESIWDADDPDYIAQDCAQNYFSAHDGWESSWPIEMTVWANDGKEIGRFSVDLEHEPTFSATRIEPTPEA